MKKLSSGSELTSASALVLTPISARLLALRLGTLNISERGGVGECDDLFLWVQIAHRIARDARLWSWLGWWPSHQCG